MYSQAIRQCAQALENMEGWLDKAERNADVRQFDVQVLMDARLAPDMKPLVYQVQSACDYVKGGAAWLSGQTPPRHEDNERTVDEVRARLRKTIAFARGVGEDSFAGAATREVSLQWAGGKTVAGSDYLLQIVLLNVYFHAAMTYAILRHNGVAVGKMDFLGPVNWMADRAGADQ